MATNTTIRRLADAGSRRVVWGLIAAILALYTVGFLGFYPRVLTNDDEASYVGQARLFVEGRTTIFKLDPLTGDAYRVQPSQYQPGTAVLMAPFVWAAGWRGAYLTPLLCLLIGVLLTARWLEDAGHSPLFALLVLSFPAALVMGRVPTSDVPSLAAVALGLWCFWRGLDRGAAWWLASGFVAGVSLTLRDSNALPFAPFFAGAALRREPKSLALVIGGLLGLGVRLLASQAVYGDPLYFKVGYTFAPLTLGERLPLYLLALVVFVPGGLVAATFYRGPRRPELVTTVYLFLCFYLFQTYGMTASAPAKRIVIALRYFIPLLPVLVFALADTTPRWWARLRERLEPPTFARVETWAARGLALGWVGLGVAALVVHFAFDRWSGARAEIRDAILQVTGTESVIVIDWPSTRKHVGLLDRIYLPVDRVRLTAESAADLARRYDDVFIAIVDRDDSDWWRRRVPDNEAFVASIRPAPALLLDRRVRDDERLRIWRLGPESATGPASPRPLPAAE